MSVFGWCTTGHHDSCRFEVGNHNGIQRCACDCHEDSGPSAPSPALGPGTTKEDE